ncbi:MAG: hypothetical protein ACI978_000864 [Oleispira sp.]
MKYNDKYNWHALRYNKVKNELNLGEFAMYSHFQFSEHLPAIPNAERFQWLLIAGNWLMLLGLTGTVLSIEVSYVFADHFSLMTQVAAHIATLLFATSIKFGYIMRCIALKGFGAAL